MADEEKDAKSAKGKKAKGAKSAKTTNRGVSTAARSAAEAKAARKAMLAGTSTDAPASVDLDVDPTVITTPDTAADHPNPEKEVADPQVVGGEAAATE
jgi:hypothetical protein